MKLRHASFFSGVGGLDLGFEKAGIATVSLSEFDPYASAVLAERFPGVRNLGDITKIDEKEVPDAEIWSGGFPCQDLSVAGKRRGFQDGTRSSLAFTFLGLVERRRPRWVVLENVAGLLSSNGGRDFGRLLREMVGLGYGVAWRTLDARHFGVAQRRRRVFVVAALDDAFGGLGGERAAEVLLECYGVCGHLAPSPEKGKETPRGSRPGVGTFGAKVARSLVARYGKDIGSTVDPGQIVHSEIDSDRVRDVDGMAEGVDDREGVEDSGQEMTIYRNRISDTLTSPNGGGRRDKIPIAIVEDGRKVVRNGSFGGFTEVGSSFGSLRASGGDMSGGKNLVIEPDSVFSFPSRFGSNAQITKDVAQAFAHSAGAPAVLRVEPSPRTLDRYQINTQEMDDALIPIGLDSHRYRVIGNGVVAPVAEFIGRRIVGVDAKHWKEVGR